MVLKFVWCLWALQPERSAQGSRRRTKNRPKYWLSNKQTCELIEQLSPRVEFRLWNKINQLASLMAK